MEQDYTTVQVFLNDLSQRVDPAYQRDMQSLQQAKERDGYNEPIYYYDVAYYTRIIDESVLGISHDALREYFSLNTVREYFFSLARDVWGVAITPVALPQWHKDVEYFQVKDTSTQEIMGYFAMDLFSREGKFTHVAVNNPWDTYIEKDTRVVPFAVFLGNFSSPTHDKPSLLSIDECVTFFHEMGHLLHVLLARVQYSQSGSFCTPIDFVELPSQLMEMFFFNKQALLECSHHYQTGEKLSKKRVKDIIASEDVMKGFFIKRQVVLGLFDFALHLEENENINSNILYRNVFQDVIGSSDVLISPHSEFPASFGHTMGGYSCGYYGYQYALVFAFDCFSLFKKDGIFSQEQGRMLRKELLEYGYARNPRKSLESFLGRKPSSKSFIQSLPRL